MQSQATSVAGYLAELPAERRVVVSTVRDVMVANLPQGMEEAMSWGMVSYQVPLSVVPDTYNGKPLMYAALAAQKRHYAVYLSGIYADGELRSWFETKYQATGLRMDLGQSCVRFRQLEEFPLSLIGEAVAALTLEQYVSHYTSTRA